MKQLNKIALALAATLAAGSVMAEGTQLYAVVGAGQAELSDFCDGSTGSCDDKDTSWKIGGGAQFNKYLAVEFQYHELGEAEDKSGGVKGGIEGKTFGIHVLPQLPITDELSVYARIGFVRAGVDGTGVENGSDYETTNSYGLGLQYDITSNIAIRAEYETLHNIGEKDGFGEDDVEYFGVSGVYKF